MMRTGKIGGLCVALLMGAAPMVQASAEAPAPLTCLLVPARTSDIGSDRTGIVRDVAVARSDLVGAGDPLVQIDTALAKADLRAAEITIAGLEERLGRSEGLLARQLISRDEIEGLRTDLSLARAQEARARMELERATIRAPFAGYVSEVAVAVGELIGPEPLIQLIEVSTLHAEMVFLHEAFGEIAKGDKLHLQVTLTGSEVEAEVFAIDPFLDAASNTFTVLARIENGDLSLPAGTDCRLAP